MSWLRVLLSVSTILAALACEPQEPPKPSFQLVIHTQTDSGEPLAGVKLTSKSANLGVSGPDGQVKTRLRGREGLRIPIGTVCPDGYRQEGKPIDVVLKSLKRPDGKSAPIVSDVKCAPTERWAALVVKTSPDIPIKVQGQVVATTNSDGVAHAALRLAPNTTFQVELDTSAKPELRPRSPVTTLTVLERDEVFPVAFEFKKKAPAAKPRKKRPRKRPPKKFRPERVD